ncbi:HK97 family phage prohead protease [Xanthobacter aminoxidans]|uniref:HK97 family phage prohead protease n=1 Tax=Xanthobacter aminoxidans TaxID=186280 RepID=UPI0020230C1B|nr:HK97 family phage prohead protease [Xanthobacter aminoxidans]MCL8385813.1 HK97 family phage prohead protease [Xanthobacter aminoxidans]
MGEPFVTLQGYACLFHVVDLGRDEVLPGAFAESLARRPAGEVRMLLEHDPRTSVGTWTEMREDAKGLFVRGHLAPGQRSLTRTLWERRPFGLSIGFKTLRCRRERPGIRTITQVDLWEISFTAFPMQPGAAIDEICIDYGPRHTETAA